jgi:protein SCO1/2
MVVFLLGGCGGGGEPESEPAPAPEPSEQHFEGVGVVESVDISAGSLTIDHEEIPDFMGAMAMPYDVLEASLLEGLEPGAKVRFGVLVLPDGNYLVDYIVPEE